MKSETRGVQKSLRARGPRSRSMVFWWIRKIPPPFRVVSICNCDMLGSAIMNRRTVNRIQQAVNRNFKVKPYGSDPRQARQYVVCCLGRSDGEVLWAGAQRRGGLQVVRPVHLQLTDLAEGPLPDAQEGPGLHGVWDRPSVQTAQLHCHGRARLVLRAQKG